jgi:hypothetical protein
VQAGAIRYQRTRFFPKFIALGNSPAQVIFRFYGAKGRA